MTIQLPTDLEEQVSALAQSGVYESPDAIVRDALQTLLAARPDLRETVACILYQREVFSLGRAVEWSGLSIEALKAALARRGITREAPESVAEIERMARETMARAGRPPA
ncbi:MAG: hypothetical protein GY719_20060 [bacterium]|nr:hypothetical protein [bacterium]